MKNRASWIACAGAWLAASVAVAAPDTGGSAALLQRELAGNEAVIWYLGQDSFAIKTRNHLLIFDPLSPGMENSYALPKSADALADGLVNPEALKDLDVVVFVSNMADTHYGTGIWAWRRHIRKISYVFGWDPIINQDNHEYFRLRPRTQRTIDGIDITTIQADTHGSGFLVKVDGLVLFHGGSHIQLEPGLKARFNSEIDFLAARGARPDIAFLEFQAGAGNRPPSIANGIWYAEQKLAPRVIVPMGAMNGEIPWRERRTPAGQAAAATTYETLIKDLMAEAPSAAVRAKLVETGKRGSVFLYRDGKLARL